MGVFQAIEVRSKFAIGILLATLLVAGTAAASPVITTLSTTSGPIGSTVTVSGSGFGATQGSSSIAFNGTTAVPCSACWSDSSISVVIPTSATTGNVVVTVGGVASNGVSFSVLSLPSSWLDTDVGSVGTSGSATYANGVFTVNGAGSTIYGTADSFHFVYQSLSGDGSIVARIINATGTSNAIVGVMIRETMNAGAINAKTAFWSSSAVYADYRSTTGGSTNEPGDLTYTSYPYWIKVTRSGSTFSAYASPDGVNWTAVGASQTITMASSAYIGLAVCSRNTSTLATVTFDNVSVTSSSSTPPAITSVSATTGPTGAQVQIYGSGFGSTQAGSVVMLSGAPVPINSWSSSSITITIPATATSGHLLVSVGPTMNDSNWVEFTVTGNPLPAGWLDEDIGSVGTTGSATFANGVFTVNGAGTTIDGTADSFHFAYQPLSGDGSISARVVSISGTTNAIVGVMIRETAIAGATNAKLAYWGTSYIYFDFRQTTGGSTSEPGYLHAAVPYWIKVARSGNTFTVFTSSDGVNWTQLSTSQTVTMAQNVYLGLAVSSRNTSTLATATFDNVSVASTSAPGPVITSVSATTGPVGSQVWIYGSGFGATQGASAVTLNGTSVTINSWSDGAINVTIPSGATTGRLLVTVAPSMDDSNPVQFTITSNPLPPGALDADVGPDSSAGSATYSNNVYTLKSTGTGVGGGNGGSSLIDGFHFAYWPLPGDGEIVARLKTLSGGWAAQAGLMIRETFAENATNVFLAADAISNPTFYFDYRTSTGTSETYTTSSTTSLPVWIKLSRSGSTFSAYTSPDGINWTQFGSSLSIAMAQNVYIGLAVSGGNNGATVANATFDYVSFTTTSQPAPVIGSLSATTGSAGTQVILSGAGFGQPQGGSFVTLNGTTATVNSWSNNSITITIPSGATSGYLAVTVAPSMNDSNVVAFEVTSTPLPQGWIDQDVGPVGVSGSSTFANNVFTIQAAGYGVGGTSYGGFGGSLDSFHFVYQAMTGDGSISARVVTAPSGQAGITIRETVDDTGSLNAFVTYFPQNTDIVFADRTSEGGSESSLTSSASVTLPYWIKLVRSGNSFTTYMSADSVTWSQVGTTQTISMPQTVYIGMAATSHNTGSSATLVFDNVSLNTTQVPAPSITSVSSTTGAVGSQVVISGSGFGESQGSSEVLLNNVPVTVNSWDQNSITISIPTGATSGPLVVSVAPAMNDSNAFHFSVTSNPLPTGWLDQDVGSVGVAGNASYSSGTFTINGGGYGIGGTGGGYGGAQDAFHFVYQPLAGNGTMIARVVTDPGTTGQAGILIRQGLDSGSLNVFLGNFPQNGEATVFDRVSTGSGESLTYYTNLSLPYWVKVVRNGDSFTFFTSTDGTSWTQLGSTLAISMSQNVYIGLAASGGSTSTLGTATFDNVSLSFSGWGTSPTITSVSPTSGQFGATVTISGSNFGAAQGTSTVTFNGTTATPCGTCWSNTSVTVPVPNSATTGNIIVNVGGVNSNGVTFGVFNPTISGIAPQTAQANAVVTLSGSGFGPNSAGNLVQFNGISAEVMSWSDSTISVQVPANATSGSVTVMEGGVTSNAVSFSVETLSVTGIIPNMALPGSAVVISGTGFGPSQSNSQVQFNGIVAAVQSWSDTQITVTVPTGTTSGSVIVSVGGIGWFGPFFTVETQAQVTDSQSHQTTYLFAMIGGVWTPVQAQGSGCSTCTVRGTISYAYDGSGNPLSRTDENGNTTTYTYDINNNPLTVTVPIASGHTATTTYTYNGFGEVLTATDPLGNVTTNTYDIKGNLLSVKTPAPGGGATASVTQFAYNGVGELTQITDPLGNQTNIAYSSTGMIQTITDAQSNVTTYAYDSRGNRTSVTDANNKQTTFAYDAMNRLTKITYPDSTTTQFGYDVRGRRTSVTDQNAKVTSYAYDDADRLVGVSDANISSETGCIGTDSVKHSTCYGYDTESNLTSVTDANNNTTSFAYDAFGRVTQTTFPSGSVENYSYDNVGNLTGKTDRKNQQITYTYDQLNRVTKKTYPDTSTVNYTYDDDSRMTQVSDPTGTYAFTFDNVGRLTGTTTNYAFLTGRTFVTSYGYDAASNRTMFIDPESGSTSYAYDSLNRLQTLTPPAAISSGSFGFGYDALSRRTSLTRPNSVSSTYAYDNLSRILSVTHAKAGATLDGASYGLDNAGNRTSKTDLYANLTTNYGYDGLYELLSATQGTTATESYTYDSVGNRLTQLGSATWSYNTSNELNSRPAVSYTYDANGNTTTKTDSTGTTTYAWDYDNRLTSATLPGSGGSVSYRYDPFGRRIYKSSSAGTSVYAYDADNLVEETNATGGVVARYSQGLNVDEPLVMLRSGTASYYEADGVWSVTSLSNTTGALAQTYAFDSFGKLAASSGSLTNPFQYTGREFDTETSLQFSRARFYDPSVGRFLSEDPEGFDAGPNFYTYVRNNPVAYRDPFGLDVVVCLFPKGANGLGHTGYGFPGDPFTVGFYPAASGVGNPRRAHGPGELRPDVGEGPRTCKLIHTTPDQDACMLQQRVERLRNPGTYDLYTRQCTGFVRNSLQTCGIPAGSSQNPIPRIWFPTLPGQVIPNLPPDGPLPRNGP